MDLLEKLKALKSKREFEPHHRSPLTKTMTDNWQNERNSVIENWHINSSRKDDRELKATERTIAIDKDNKKDFDERKGYNHVVPKTMEVEKEVEKERNSIEILQKKKLDIINEDKEKGMERQQGNSTLTNSKETLRKEIDIGKDIEKERNMIRKERENDSLVNNNRTNNSPRNNDSLKEKIDERLKSIKRSMIYTQDNSLAELAKKIEILNSPLDIDRKRDITVLNNIELSDNEKTDRHIRNTIYHKCKEYGHTKKQCDKHSKIVKQINKLEFEKDVINELMEMFDIKQKEINQVKKKKELKSTNPLKVNKRKRNKKT